MPLLPMSTSIPDPGPALASGEAAARSRTVRLPAWAHEPLLHFALLGFALFAIDHFLVARQDDPKVIVVSAEVDDEARRLFAASRGRAPNADELKALRDRWIDNEVLYREGLALRVDQGDPAIRERVIFKALSVVDAGTRLPRYDDALLRSWFEARRAKYDEPARYDFEEAVTTGDMNEAAIRAFADTLNAGAPGDAKAGLRVFKGRPRDNVVQSYGADFAKALDRATPGEWRVQGTVDGLRVVRLVAIAPPRPADFESLRGVVLQDWTDATLAEQRTAAVRAMAKKYRITIAGSAR
jgi:hypothetical protein